MHDASLPAVEVDLKGVARGVAEDPRLVALIGGAVIEPGVRECEYRGDVPRGHRELGQEQQRIQDHFRIVGRGRAEGPGGGRWAGGPGLAKGVRLGLVSRSRRRSRGQ